MILELRQNTSVKMIFNWVRKRRLKTPLRFWVECLMELNSAAFDHATVEELARHAGVPVWNGLTDKFHPTQILADFMTIEEHVGKLKGTKLVFCWRWS